MYWMVIPVNGDGLTICTSIAHNCFALHTIMLKPLYDPVFITNEMTKCHKLSVDLTENPLLCLTKYKTFGHVSSDIISAPETILLMQCSKYRSFICIMFGISGIIVDIIA